MRASQNNIAKHYADPRRESAMGCTSREQNKGVQEEGGRLEAQLLLPTLPRRRSLALEGMPNSPRLSGRPGVGVTVDSVAYCRTTVTGLVFRRLRRLFLGWVPQQSMLQNE